MGGALDELASIWETGSLVAGLRFATFDHAVVVFGAASRPYRDQLEAALRWCGVEWTGEDGVLTDVRFQPPR